MNAFDDEAFKRDSLGMLIECNVDKWTESSAEVTLRGRWGHAEAPSSTGESSLLLSASGRLIGIVLDSPSGARFIAMRGPHDEVATQVRHPARFTLQNDELLVVIPRTSGVLLLQ